MRPGLGNLPAGCAPLPKTRIPPRQACGRGPPEGPLATPPRGHGDFSQRAPINPFVRSCRVLLMGVMSLRGMRRGVLSPAYRRGPHQSLLADLPGRELMCPGECVLMGSLTLLCFLYFLSMVIRTLRDGERMQPTHKSRGGRGPSDVVGREERSGPIHHVALEQS